MLAELLLLVRQPKVLFSSFEFFEKCEVTSFCKKFRSRWLQWFCIWNWMFLLSLLYLAIVRMINKDFVVVSCSAVMRSNNVMSWKVRGNKKRKIFWIYSYTFSPLLLVAGLSFCILATDHRWRTLRLFLQGSELKSTNLIFNKHKTS